MFHFSSTSLDGVILIEPTVYSDERGFFMETYSQKDFINNWIDASFVQYNHSKSAAWVLRWLHFQTTQTQSKLVRVISGSIYDVAVDLRKNSLTYWKYYGLVLSAENKKQLFIPTGFAHWFLTLENNTEVIYSCDDYYNPESEKGIIYNDQTIGIDWGKYFDEKYFILSKKDSGHHTFVEFHTNNPF